MMLFFRSGKPDERSHTPGLLGMCARFTPNVQSQHARLKPAWADMQIVAHMSAAGNLIRTHDNK